MSVVVTGNHIVGEAIAKKLHGISGVPPMERIKMVGRASKIACEMYDEVVANEGILEANIRAYREALVLIRDKANKGASAVCASIADRALDEL